VTSLPLQAELLAASKTTVEVVAESRPTEKGSHWLAGEAV
jgi:hypothetical protein